MEHKQLRHRAWLRTLGMSMATCLARRGSPPQEGPGAGAEEEEVVKGVLPPFPECL